MDFIYSDILVFVIKGDSHCMILPLTILIVDITIIGQL